MRIHDIYKKTSSQWHPVRDDASASDADRGYIGGKTYCHIQGVYKRTLSRSTLADVGTNLTNGDASLPEAWPLVEIARVKDDKRSWGTTATKNDKPMVTYVLRVRNALQRNTS